MLLIQLVPFLPMALTGLYVVGTLDECLCMFRLSVFCVSVGLSTRLWRAGRDHTGETTAGALELQGPALKPAKQLPLSSHHARAALATSQAIVLKGLNKV